MLIDLHSFATLAPLVKAVLFGLAAFGIVGAAPAAAPAADTGGAPAGGGAPSSTPAAEPDARAADPTGDPADDERGAGDLVAGDGDGHEPTDEEVDELEELLPHLSESQLRTRLRRTQRFNKRVSPLVERLRKPGTKEYMSPEDVDAAVSMYRDLDPILRASPDALQYLIKERDRVMQGGGGRPAPEEPAPFDEENWPFETDTPQGKALLSLAKQNHDLSANYKRLEGRLGNVDQRFESQTHAQLEGQWKTATLKAALEIPDELYRPMFVQHVYERFNALKSTGQLTRANAQQVIDKMLAPIRAATKKKQRTTVTRQSEVIAANTGLPRTPRPGTVLPASGEKPAGRETIKDARSSFLRKYAGG